MMVELGVKSFDRGDFGVSDNGFFTWFRVASFLVLLSPSLPPKKVLEHVLTDDKIPVTSAQEVHC